MPIHLRLLLLALILAGPWAQGVEPAPADPTDLLTPPAEVMKTPMPDADALKRALAAIKELYAAEYASAKSRVTLIQTLIDQALQTNDDPATRYALLHEARELAIAAKEVNMVLTVSEQLAKGFEGPDAAAQQRASLLRISGVAVVPPLLKLLDAPGDPTASGVVGRWYANEVQDWEHALPLLAQGGDALIAKAAAAELLAPAKPAEQTAVADQWYDLGKRSTTVRESFWRHALGLYDHAKTSLTGLSLAVVEKRMAEIEAILPLGPDIDYTHLSAGQWDRLKGKIITVDAARGINPTTITLSEGQKIRVVPHPTDTWKVSDNRGVDQQTTWKGGMQGRRAVGSLQCVVGTGIEQTPGIISGVGQLTLFALTPPGGPRKRVTMSGTIRVKILPVTD